MKGLKYFRQRAGLSQTALADILGITRQAVSLWETGINWPSAALLPQIADLLLCSIDDLFQEHPETELEEEIA